jgi:hypothetical protein
MGNLVQRVRRIYDTARNYTRHINPLLLYASAFFILACAYLALCLYIFRSAS